jgi:hypothetical protein
VEERRQREERREEAYKENTRTLCVRICSLVLPVNTDGGWRTDQGEEMRRGLQEERESASQKTPFSFSL